MLLAVHSNLKYHSVLRGQIETFEWSKVLFYSGIICILFFPQVIFSLELADYSNNESRML